MVLEEVGKGGSRWMAAVAVLVGIQIFGGRMCSRAIMLGYVTMFHSSYVFAFCGFFSSFAASRKCWH